MVLTRGQQSEIRYVEESSPGSTPSNPAFKLFSTQTKRIAPVVDKELLEGTDIAQLDVEEWIHEQETYEIQVEFLMQRPDEVQKFAERQSDNTPRSFTLEWIPNADASTTHYIRLKGFRPQSIDLNGAVGSAWSVTVTFVGENIDTPTTTDPGIGTGSREAHSSISDTINTFAGAEVQQGGATWAAIVNNVSVTIDHGTELEHTSGQQAPAEVTYGHRTITGSADLAFEDGTKPLFDETDNETEFTVNIPWGTSTGDPQWDLTTATSPNWSPEQGVDDNHIMGAREFNAQSISFTTV